MEASGGFAGRPPLQPRESVDDTVLSLFFSFPFHFYSNRCSHKRPFYRVFNSTLLGFNGSAAVFYWAYKCSYRIFFPFLPSFTGLFINISRRCPRKAVRAMLSATGLGVHSKWFIVENVFQFQRSQRESLATSSEIHRCITKRLGLYVSGAREPFRWKKLDENWQNLALQQRLLAWTDVRLTHDHRVSFSKSVVTSENETKGNWTGSNSWSDWIALVAARWRCCVSIFSSGRLVLFRVADAEVTADGGDIITIHQIDPLGTRAVRTPP